MNASGVLIELRTGARSRVWAWPRRFSARASELVTGPELSALCRTAPADVVTFSAVQGGGGTSTVTLLVCCAATLHSDRPALAIDLAGPTRGGLGARAGVCSQTTAEATAYLVLDGHALVRPYAETPEGVHLISAPPDSAVRADHAARRLLSRLADADARLAASDQLAAIVREELAEHAFEQLVGEDGREQRDALHTLIAGSRPPHSLIGVDLGLSDPDTLREYGPDSDLHVWVIAARADDLELAQRRLAAAPVSSEREVIVAWIPAGHTVSTRDLRLLAQTRACPLVRLPTCAAGDSWQQRVATCEASIEALCHQLP